jgi:hypothetical protein
VSRGDAVKRERSKAVMMSLVMGKRKGKERRDISSNLG